MHMQVVVINAWVVSSGLTSEVTHKQLQQVHKLMALSPRVPAGGSSEREGKEPLLVQQLVLFNQLKGTCEGRAG